MCVFLTKIKQASVGVALKKTMGKSLARWLLSALILWVLINENAGCLEEERIGLLKLKEFFKLEGFSGFREDYTDFIPSWISNRASNCCDWEGVTCDSITDHVTILSFASLDIAHLPISCSLNLTLFSPFKNLESLNLTDFTFSSITINVDGIPTILMRSSLCSLPFNYLVSSNCY